MKSSWPKRRLTMETLDARRVCAGLTGFVAIDSNQNGQFDSGSTNPDAIPIDQPVKAAQVWIDSNGNGQLDPDEPQSLTDSNGSYQFSGVGVGTHSVRVTHTPGLIQTSELHVVHFYRNASTGKFGLASTNLQSGVVTNMSAAGGIIPLFGLVETNQGEYYATSFQTDALYRIDPVTGEQTLIGPLGKGVIGDLAYDPMNDKIYTLAHGVNDNPETEPLSLYSIDRKTAAMTAIAPGVGVLGVRGTSAMAFDTIERRLVIFDNNKDEFISYDLNGQPTRVSRSSTGLAFYNMFFDGTRFLTVIPNATDSSLLEVNVDTAQVTFAKKLDKPLHGEAASALSMYRPKQVVVSQDDDFIRDQNFLFRPLDLPDVSVQLDNGGTTLSSDSKKVTERSPADIPLLTVLYCIAQSGATVVVSGSSEVAQNKQLQLGDANDTVEIQGPFQLRLHAGAGNDTVKVAVPMDIDLDSWLGEVEGVDAIDLRNHGRSTLSPTAEQVVGISDAKKLMVLVTVEDSLDLVNGAWKLGAPGTSAGQRVHRYSQGEALLDVVNEQGWLNPSNALDVNADGSVTALDALLIINQLNRLAGPLTIQDESLATAAYIDTNGDNSLTPIDALLVINQLNGAN